MSKFDRVVMWAFRIGALVAAVSFIGLGNWKALSWCLIAVAFHELYLVEMRRSERYRRALQAALRRAHR